MCQRLCVVTEFCNRCAFHWEVHNCSAPILIGWLWFSPNVHIIGLFLRWFLLTSIALFCDLISARTDTRHDSLIRAHAVFFCRLQEKIHVASVLSNVFSRNLLTKWSYVSLQILDVSGWLNHMRPTCLLQLSMSAAGLLTC